MFSKIFARRSYHHHRDQEDIDVTPEPEPPHSGRPEYEDLIGRTFSIHNKRTKNKKKSPFHPKINPTSHKNSNASDIIPMNNDMKKFSFNDYDVIGFDLDFTLLRYSINRMTPLIYENLRRYLVEQKSYPSCLLSAEMNIDFMQRGLILDAEKGNILKLGSDGTILQATHGTKLLTELDISSMYGKKKTWDLAISFINDPLSLWNGPQSLKLRFLLDYFDFSVGMLFAHAIDLMDAQLLPKNAEKLQTYRVYADIFDGLAEMFNRHQFDSGQSAYFRHMRAQPERFILKTCPTIIDWLRKLHQAKKFIVLITGSRIDQGNFTATYALGKDWQSLFDSVIFLAKKPAFFVEQKPFMLVENMQEVPYGRVSVDCDLELNRPYARGNWQQLLRTIAHKKCKPLDRLRSLYVGDNHLLDVYIPVKHSGTDAVAICEELVADRSTSDFYEDRKFVISKFWGPYLGTRVEPTIWMRIISEYSVICTPFLENFADKPVAHTYVTSKPGGFLL